MNREELIRELVNLGRSGGSDELPVVSRGFEVESVEVRTDESGRKWIELGSAADKPETHRDRRLR